MDREHRHREHRHSVVALSNCGSWAFLGTVNSQLMSEDYIQVGVYSDLVNLGQPAERATTSDCREASVIIKCTPELETTPLSYSTNSLAISWSLRIQFKGPASSLETPD